MRRLFERWRSRRRIHAGQSIWYHPAYAAPLLSRSSRVAGLKPKRGELVLTRLVQDRLVRTSDVSVPKPASFEALRLFHSDSYLADVARAERLGPIFGLEPDVVDVDQLLDAARWGVGGTMAASVKAIERRTVALNLGGGFHHAEPDTGSGFCVYNDVGVAIRALRADGHHERIAIIDLDFHQGNGNSAAFAGDTTVLSYSIHGAVWRRSDDAQHEHHLTGTVDDGRYREVLERTLGATLRSFRPQLIFYIAGMDVLASDPLGLFDLTLEGVFERDRFVLDLARSHGAALVVTMAGGYSDEAWIGFYNLARYVLTGRRRVWRPRPPDLPARFSAIAKALDPIELTRDRSNEEITEADVFGDLLPERRASRLLDYYSRHGVEVALERYGLLGAVRRRGFRAIEIAIEPNDPTRQVVRVTGRKNGVSERMLLVELVVRKTNYTAPWDSALDFEMLEIMWLLLQDPSRSFTLARPPMPGQDHPGLGIASLMREVLVQAALRLDLGGLMNRPSHFHNARVAASRFHFALPEVEGRFIALSRALNESSLADASRAVESGKVRDASGATYRWEPDDHILPVTPPLVSYFESKSYVDVRDSVARETRFTVVP